MAKRRTYVTKAATGDELGIGFDATDDGNLRFLNDQAGRNDLHALHRQFETSLQQIF
jgi:hypothetical protein